MVGAYCFGDLDEAKQEIMERHLLVCDPCWREAHRLLDTVDIIRTTPGVARRARTPQVIGALGISGRLDRAFAGHWAIAAVLSGLYALLFAVPVLVEIAYQFDRYRSRAIPLAVATFAWMFASTLSLLAHDARVVRQGRLGFGIGLAAMAVSTAVVCAFVLPLLPAEPMTRASFGTWPAQLAFLKSVFYAWLVGPVFVLWLFHFIVVMQKQLTLGRSRAVLALLSGDKSSLPPKGVGRPNTSMLAAYLAMLFVINYAGVNHLFANLEPGPHQRLFMVLLLVRATAWLTLPALGLVWYTNSLNELKRECLVVESLDPQRINSHQR